MKSIKEVAKAAEVKVEVGKDKIMEKKSVVKKIVIVAGVAAGTYAVKKLVIDRFFGDKDIDDDLDDSDIEADEVFDIPDADDSDEDIED